MTTSGTWMKQGFSFVLFQNGVLLRRVRVAREERRKEIQAEGHHSFVCLSLWSQRKTSIYLEGRRDAYVGLIGHAYLLVTIARVKHGCLGKSLRIF